MVFSGEKKIDQPPLLARVLWSPPHDSCLFFTFLGTVKEMCLQQVYRQHGEMESRLGHGSAGWGSTLHLSGHWLSPSKSLKSSMASVPVWKIMTLRPHRCPLWALMEPHVHIYVVIDHMNFSWSPVLGPITSRQIGDSLEKGPHLSPSRL